MLGLNRLHCACRKLQHCCDLLMTVLNRASLQVVMELVRGQQVGVFHHALFNRACTVLLQQLAFGQDAIELLISKFMQYADVR